MHDPKVHEELARMNDILTRLTTTVEYHVKRTDLLEKRLDSLPQKVLVLISICGGMAALVRVMYH